MNKKKLVSVLAGVMAAVMLLSLLGGLIVSIIPAHAQKSSSEIEDEIEELEEEKAQIDEQIAQLESQLDANMDEMEAIVAQKNIIDQEVFLLYEQMENINAQLTAYGQLVADKQEELDAAKENLTYLNEKHRDRILAMEKNGSVSYWSVLFQASSFLDLLDRVRMVTQIAEADRRCLDELNAAAAQVEQAKGELEAQVDNLEAMREELKLAEEELAAKRAEADALLMELVARGEEYEALIMDAEEEIGQLLDEIAQKEHEYDAAKDREYQEWLAQQPPPSPPQTGGGGGGSGNPGNVGGSGVAGTPRTVNGITWLVPMTYYHFTSPFGWRIHPIYKDYRFHYGVDLSAASGTPIYATRAGVVTTATYGSSGGWYVAINHQDGYSSNYLHMTNFVVSVGQYVQAGQLIGYCGSTGASTGPHLHFSIYYYGTAVNPADYIAI